MNKLLSSLLFFSFIGISLCGPIRSNLYINYEITRKELSDTIDAMIDAKDLSRVMYVLFGTDRERWHIYNTKDSIINEEINFLKEFKPNSQENAIEIARNNLRIRLGDYAIKRSDELIQEVSVPSYKLESVKAIAHKAVYAQFYPAFNKCQENYDSCMKEFFDNLPEIATREAEKYSIDYAIIKHELIRALDTMITTNLIVNKYAIVERIIEVVKTYRPENQNQARAKAWELLYPAIEQALADYCELTARKMITQNYKNPRYNPDGIVLDIKEKEIKTSISSAVAECRNYQTFGNNNCLNDLIARLPLIIDQELRKRLGAPDYEKYQQPKPSAPPMEKPKINETGKHDDDIFEIYPQRHLDDVRIKLGSNKDYREASCCVCGEDYQGKARARVNLNCSAGVHAMCSTCFFAWVHINNKTTCPVCRSEIIKNDYPAKDVSVYVNVKELKEKCPTQLDKIKQYFPYHNLQ